MWAGTPSSAGKASSCSRVSHGEAGAQRVKKKQAQDTQGVSGRARTPAGSSPPKPGFSPTRLPQRPQGAGLRQSRARLPGVAGQHRWALWLTNGCLGRRSGGLVSARVFSQRTEHSLDQTGCFNHFILKSQSLNWWSEREITGYMQLPRRTVK